MCASKALAMTLLLAIAASASVAQQISRIAVIDFPKVVMAVEKDPTAYKDFEGRKSQIQLEIDRMSMEIKKLQTQMADADSAGDVQGSLRLKAEADRKTAAKANYAKAKIAELDELARKMTAASPSIQDIYKRIQQIAESEGYSLVLNLKAADYVMGSVVWYSSMIDITDKMIQALAH